MLKQEKIKNSTILLIGSLIIVIGICTGLYEYFEDRKDRTYSNMNILLFENEQPENIFDNKELENNLESEDNNVSSENIPEENNQIESNRPIVKYLGVLEIPKINLKKGFYDLNSRYNNVDYNITVIKGSTYPGEQNNNLILAAHSGNCTVCYFDNLHKLNINDVAYLHYNNRKYEYKIVDIYEVEKDGTVAIHRDYSKNGLTLITCTRNSNTKQTVYILEEII